MTLYRVKIQLKTNVVYGKEIELDIQLSIGKILLSSEIGLLYL